MVLLFSKCGTVLLFSKCGTVLLFSYVALFRGGAQVVTTPKGVQLVFRPPKSTFKSFKEEKAEEKAREKGLMVHPSVRLDTQQGEDSVEISPLPPSPCPLLLILHSCPITTLAAAPPPRFRA